MFLILIIHYSSCICTFKGNFLLKQASLALQISIPLPIFILFQSKAIKPSIMQRIILFFALLSVLGCAGAKKAGHSNPYNGTWIPVKQEMNGKPFPASILSGQQLIISDSIYIFQEYGTDKGLITYHKNKMDIYGREGVNAGKHFTAIFKYKNDQLVVCYNLAGDSYPIAFETNSKPTLFLSVFKRK